MKSSRVAFFLAAKSIARGNFGVTLLTVAMLILSNLNLLFGPSLVNGIVHSANQKLIDTYSSNIIIEPKGDSQYIRNVDQLANEIKTVEGVTGVTYHNSMGAELTYNDEHVNATIKAIPPQLEKQVFKVADAVFEGSYLDDNDLDDILLGVQLAGSDRSQIELYSSSLKSVHAGDKITVTYSKGIKKQYRVKGVFYTEFIQSDLQAFVTEREFRSVNPLTNNRATSVYVKIQNDAEANRVIGEISALRSDLKFKTWQDTAGIVSSMTSSFAIINGIFAAVNLLVAGITVFIVTYVDLTHKRRQIGIERAIGITPLAISLSYVFRAMFYALIGVTVSYFLYTYAVVPLELRYPFHFPFGNTALFMERSLMIRSAAVIVGVAMVASLLPVWGTIRIRLLDAIWG